MAEASEEPATPAATAPRWEVELEFVQSLANPMYVNYLAQSKYLVDEEFLRYLEYLEYWREPENAQYLVYPNCLHMLTLLKQPKFREEIVRVELAKLIMDGFWHKWDGQAEAEAEGEAGNVETKTEENPEIKAEAADEKMDIS